MSIDIVDNEFWPDYVVVKAGTEIKWVHAGTAAHDAVGMDGSWRTPSLGTGDSHQTPFNRPGEFHYFCSFHPEMVAVIVVEP